MKLHLKDIGRVCCAVTALAVAVTLSLPIKVMADVESSDPIKLAINEWTGQHITTKIAGEVLKKMGYNVEYVVAGYYPQMTAIQDGSLTATLEIWTSNIGEAYDKAIASGNAELVGEPGLNPTERPYYTPYAEEQCPGLPDYKALNECAMLFSTPETVPQGRFVDYPVEWGTTNVDRFDALGMNFKNIPAGSEGAAIAEIKSAYATKTPLVLMFWEPHWIHAVYDLKPLDLPEYDDACYTDPSWGINPDKTYDCNWDLSATIVMVAHVSLKDKWPGAYKMLQNYKIDNLLQAQLMKEIDMDGGDTDEVIAQWIAGNEATWKTWTQ